MFATHTHTHEKKSCDNCSLTPVGMYATEHKGMQCDILNIAKHFRHAHYMPYNKKDACKLCSHTLHSFCSLVLYMQHKGAKWKKNRHISLKPKTCTNHNFFSDVVVAVAVHILHELSASRLRKKWLFNLFIAAAQLWNKFNLCRDCYVGYSVQKIQ